MRRRDFLKTPALGVLIPGALDAACEDPAGAGQPDGPASGPGQLLQKLHPDFMTYLEGIEYFVFGNGEVIGALQFAPKDSPASFFGFTLWDAEVFCRKWSTFLYHPERGFTNTRVGVLIGERLPGEESRSGMFTGVKGYALTPESFLGVARTYPDGIPAVAVRWKAGSCDVQEEFWVPQRGAAVFRSVTVTNGSPEPVEVRLSASLYANFGLFDRISTDPKAVAAVARGLATMELRCLEKKAVVQGRYEVRAELGVLPPGASERATFLYAIRESSGGMGALGGTDFGSSGLRRIRTETAASWGGKTRFETGNEILDGMFKASMAGVRAVISRGMRMDAAPWMYNMEWSGDHALAAEALLHCGMPSEARAILERILDESIGEDGRTIESSRWFGYEYTELNQNGIVLWAIWVYYCWTGDLELVKKYWNRIRLCADFPLQPVFYDEKARMVHNQREGWERSDAFGVEDGFELAYQFWVSHGLSKAAELATVVGDVAAKKRWEKASVEIRDSFLHDPVYRMIEGDRLIKRRKRNGEWQQYFLPPDRSKLPPGSPIATVEKPEADPDTMTAYPVIFGWVEGTGRIASGTLAGMEKIWNQNWETGGYPRYHTSGEDNPPAPWPLASLLVARANAEAREDERVWKVLRWLDGLTPLKSYAWFERYGQSITPPLPPVSFINWVWYEILSLELWHLAGFRPGLSQMTVRPWLPMGVDRIDARLMVRGKPVVLMVRRGSGAPSAMVNGREQPVIGGSISIPYPDAGETRIEMTIP